METTLSGWGRYPRARTRVCRPETVQALRRAITCPAVPSVLPRGAGRSYGDASLNADGGTIATERLNRLLAFDEETGWLRCEAGVLLGDLVRTFLPRGWLLPVLPGTRHVSVGGAVACDVHGKNHHRDGSMGRHLGRLKLLLASGEEVVCSAQEREDLFHATVGGLGLTGAILEAEIAMTRVETSLIRQRTVLTGDLGETLHRLEEHDPHHRYTVAWIDSLAPGSALGRGVLLLGDHARLEELPPRWRRRPLCPPGQALLQIPGEAPESLLNPATVGAFNRLYRMAQSRRRGRRLVPLGSFFFPLDAVGHWNRLYGRRGFVQYQLLVPPATAHDALAEILRRCRRERWNSFLTVLKRFGPGTGWLSFPAEGYTLTLDFPVRAGLEAHLADLDRLVLEAGGRVYLAKDARLTPEVFRRMYPDLPRWLRTKAEVDPGDRFSSSLARRLGLAAGAA